jgi:hypothetical protein
MSWVLPGVCDVFAKPLWKVSELIKEDLPTFDRPMKANSGKRAGGQFLKSVLLVIKRADSWAMVGQR